MLVVLDCNVLIAGLLSPAGPPGELVSRGLAGEFEIVVSKSLLIELAKALAAPKLRKRVTAEEASAFVELLAVHAIGVADPEPPAARSADPKDDYLLALAESARALLVSGDRHLLDLAPGLPIRSPREFLESLGH